MKPTEAAALLAVAAAFDNRKPDADQAKAWAMALDGFRFDECRDAIVAHYRTSNEWLMPSKVISEVRKVRYKRIEQFGYIAPPSHMNFADGQAYILAIRERVAAGELTREQHDADERALGWTGDRECPALEGVFQRVDRAELAAARLRTTGADRAELTNRPKGDANA